MQIVQENAEMRLIPTNNTGIRCESGEEFYKMMRNFNGKIHHFAKTVKAHIFPNNESIIPVECLAEHIRELSRYKRERLAHDHNMSWVRTKTYL